MTTPWKASCWEMAASSPACWRARSMSPRALISVAGEELEKAHAQAGQRYIAAPVFGRPDVAAAGRLFVVAAGEKAVVETAAPLLDAIGQKTFVVSSSAKAANLVGSAANFPIASVIESLGEAMALISVGRRRSAAVSRSSHLDAVRRPRLRDIRRADRGREIRAGRFRGASWP